MEPFKSVYTHGDHLNNPSFIHREMGEFAQAIGADPCDIKIRFGEHDGSPVADLIDTDAGGVMMRFRFDDSSVRAFIARRVAKMMGLQVEDAACRPA